MGFSYPSESEAIGRPAALQYNLPATWEGMRKRGLGPSLLAKLWAEEPAKLAGLHKRKGRIARGFDADFVVRRCPPVGTTTCSGVSLFALVWAEGSQLKIISLRWWCFEHHV